MPLEIASEIITLFLLECVKEKFGMYNAYLVCKLWNKYNVEDILKCYVSCMNCSEEVLTLYPKITSIITVIYNYKDIFHVEEEVKSQFIKLLR